MRLRSRGSVLALVAAGAVGCSDDAGRGPETAPAAPERRTPAADALDTLYARDHLVEIAIELDPTDWNELRGEGRGERGLCTVSRRQD